MSTTEDLLVGVVDEGLGNSAYLLDLGDGRALAVDAPRDLRAVRHAARQRGLTIAYAADTHLHADFLSGAVQLAATDSAAILASAAGGRRFAHRGLRDGDDVDLGGLTLRALATPGHTDEHLSFVVYDGSVALGVFTGGSLIVGAAARTDLMGDDRTIELAHAQYESLNRLSQLPDATEVWPTHGAGSFCSAPPGAARTSTIGAEKRGNLLLGAPDADTFVHLLTESLGTYPAYFSWLTEANRRGPAVITGEPTLTGLEIDEVRRLIGEGATVVDVRPVTDVAAGHIPGAIAIPLRGQFATWLGWVVDPEASIVIVRNPDQNPSDIVWPALNIGYGNIRGELAAGMPGWIAAGLETTTTAIVRPHQIALPVLDVRQDNEWEAGHLPSATHIELGGLPTRASEVDGEPLVVMCGHGERAMTAATLLLRAGHTDVSVLRGGADDWAKVTGNSLQQGA